MVPDRQKVRTDGMDGQTTLKLYPEIIRTSGSGGHVI